MTAPDTLRVGICGIGQMGMRHLAALVRREDVAVRAVADPSSAALARALDLVAGTGGSAIPAAYADAEDLLASDELDCVILATPSRLHARHCLAATTTGVAILVEKPIATSVEDAQAVVHEIERTATLLAVGHVERFNPVVEALRRLLDDMPLGRTTLIETWRHNVPSVVASEGVGLDLGIHDVDLICELLSEYPVSVDAAPVDPAAIPSRLAGELRFGSGAAGRLSVRSDARDRQRRILVHCVEGEIDVDCLRQEMSYRNTGDEDWITSAWPGEALVREHDAFIAAVCAGSPTPVSARSGLRALAIVEALVASAHRGEPVAVPDYSVRG